jgi:hypothetical protein
VSKCAQCGGEFLGGEPMHEVTVSDNGVVTVQFFCIECEDCISSACWNDEEWGPYQSRVPHLPGPGVN